MKQGLMWVMTAVLFLSVANTSADSRFQIGPGGSGSAAAGDDSVRVFHALTEGSPTTVGSKQWYEAQIAALEGELEALLLREQQAKTKASQTRSAYNTARAEVCGLWARWGYSVNQRPAACR